MFVSIGLATFALASPPGLIAHEWGTFTAVAGADGAVLDWRPLAGPSDLPSFVHQVGDGYGDRNQARNTKGQLRGTVRMETPVIYFYPPTEMEIRVAVDFPNGRVTEWYPAAESLDGGIDWGTFLVTPAPHRAPKLPVLAEESHYYAARAVPEAATVRVCVAGAGDPVEEERFLFYRGVGSFPLSLSARLDGNTLRLSGPPGRVVVFDRRGERIGVASVDLRGGDTAVPRPILDDDLARATAATRSILTATGLYPDEVESMLATWDGDWFEEGLRVFWVLPPSETDRLLPLRIDPQPVELVRTLIGRVELITPELAAAVSEVLRTHPDPREALAVIRTQQSRFAEPVLQHLAASADPAAGLARAALATLGG